MYTFLKLGHWGDLGNQLFQIAAVTGHALRHGQPSAFPRWPLRSCFCNPPDLLRAFGPGFRTYREPCFQYCPIPGMGSGDVDLFGYFQSWRYFEHCQSAIMKMFVPTPEVLAAALQKCPMVMESDMSCSVHVRRGNYLTTSKGAYTELLPDGYYRRAMEAVGPSRFFVFSDDPMWCRHHFRHLGVTVVDTGSAIQDFVLMSLCRNNIIANSSFSWWAAWLNPNPGKRVISPVHSQWFAGTLQMLNTQDLIPSEWIQIAAT